jgi:DNA-binding MarR family transcriptional regulator
MAEDEMTEDPTTGLESMLCFDLYAASRAMTAAYRPVLATHGLTYPQYLVLVALWNDDDVHIKDLAATLHLDHATLTPLLRRLEDRGLLSRVRSRDDARAVRVALTAVGDELRSIVDDVHCAVTDAVGLGADERAAVQDALQRLVVSLSAQPAGQRG